MAALSSDLCKVQQLVQQAGEALAADPAASVAVSDTAAMLETMHETHLGHLLPRVTACHAAVEAFAAQCLDCKVRGWLGSQLEQGFGAGLSFRTHPADMLSVPEP